MDELKALKELLALTTAQRDAALAELAALKKRVADATRRVEHTTKHGTALYALVRLTEEEA